MKTKRNDKRIDLGTARFETKGGPVGKEDINRTFLGAFGLSAD